MSLITLRCFPVMDRSGKGGMDTIGRKLWYNYAGKAFIEQKLLQAAGKEDVYVFKSG